MKECTRGGVASKSLFSPFHWVEGAGPRVSVSLYRVASISPHPARAERLVESDVRPSPMQEALRVLCDLIFLIILRDKQKNNAKHSLAAIETITTSTVFSIICGFFINYLTLFLDGRNERRGFVAWKEIPYYCLFIYRNAIFSPKANPDVFGLFSSSMIDSYAF